MITQTGQQDLQTMQINHALNIVRMSGEDYELARQVIVPAIVAHKFYMTATLFLSWCRHPGLLPPVVHEETWLRQDSMQEHPLWLVDVFSAKHNRETHRTMRDFFDLMVALKSAKPGEYLHFRRNKTGRYGRVKLPG